MTSYCVFKFSDESLGRIAPIEYVRLSNKKKFSPVSAKDIPEDLVQIKWQKSLADGSFSEDGYFDAEIFALAGSVETAKAKAAELKIKLFGNPVFALPSAQSPSSSERSKEPRSRKCKTTDHRKADSSKMEGRNDGKAKKETEPRKADSSKKEGGNEGKNKKDKERRKGDSRDRKRSHDKSNDSSVNDSSGGKKKKLPMSDVALNRTSALAIAAASANPLLQECKDKSKAEDNDEPDKAEDLASEQDKDEHDQAEKLFKSPIDQSVVTQNSSTEEDDDDDDLDRTLPLDDEGLATEIVPIPSPASSSSSSSDSAESEDEVSKLSEENEKLTKEWKEFKSSLDQCQRDLTLANNLRIAQKEQLAKAKKDLEEKTKQVDTLLRRNNALQDLLCTKQEGSTELKVRKTSSVSPPKFLFSTKRNLFSPKKTLSSPKRTLSSPLKWVSSARGDDGFMSPQKRSPRRSLEFNGSSDHSPATPDNQNSGDKKSKEKKKKRIKDTDLLLDPVVCKVSDQILNHFNGSQPLTPDEKGFISIGPHNVKIDKEALERNLEDYKGDLTKLAKSMATLAWTSSQREQRSLEGGKNNRFPDAPPKKAATPFKVNTCLGVLKAHLLHQGDNEGTGMAQNLKQARKSIGNKFAQDSATSKKK